MYPGLFPISPTARPLTMRSPMNIRSFSVAPRIWRARISPTTSPFPRWLEATVSSISPILPPSSCTMNSFRETTSTRSDTATPGTDSGFYTIALSLVYIVVAAALIILLIFPIFFQKSVLRPVDGLLKGVSQLNEGNLDVVVPVHSEDEFGYLSASFNNMVRSIKRADQLKDEFPANTPHELRTPLNGIIGIADSLIDGAAGSLNQEVVSNLSLSRHIERKETGETRR